MRVRLVKTSDRGFKPLLKRILGRRGNREDDVERRVTEIVGAVQKHGDRALLKYTEMFDRIRLTPATIEVQASDVERALAKVPRQDLTTLRLAAKASRCFIAANCRKAGSIAIL